MQALVVPRRSRVTIPVQDAVLRQARVATHIHARTGRVVAEQTQTFDRRRRRRRHPQRHRALGRRDHARADVADRRRLHSRRTARAQLALANFSDDDARVDVKTVVVGGERRARADGPGAVARP